MSTFGFYEIPTDERLSYIEGLQPKQVLECLCGAITTVEQNALLRIIFDDLGTFRRIIEASSVTEGRALATEGMRYVVAALVEHLNGLAADDEHLRRRAAE